MDISHTLKLLRVDSSARTEDSVTRHLSDLLIAHLSRHFGPLNVKVRDLARTPPPFVDAAWVDANFTDPQARTPEQRAALSHSDDLVEELLAADILVIGMPLYNFAIPATLKAWIDMVARARVTFRYSETGVEGLLKGKQAYVIMASGGVALGTAADFASTYMRHVLGFLGIRDVEFVAADRLSQNPDAQDLAVARIQQLQSADAA